MKVSLSGSVTEVTIFGNISFKMSFESISTALEWCVRIVSCELKGCNSTDSCELSIWTFKPVVVLEVVVHLDPENIL